VRLAQEGADIIIDNRADDSHAEQALALVRAAGRRG
jgi:hypothetical protein